MLNTYIPQNRVWYIGKAMSFALVSLCGMGKLMDSARLIWKRKKTTYTLYTTCQYLIFISSLAFFEFNIALKQKLLQRFPEDKRENNLFKCYTWSLPPLPPKLIWASISFSKAFKSSTIFVTMAGRGDVVPQPCHSCNVIAPSTASLERASLWGEPEVEHENGLRRVLGFESMSVLVEKAREGEHLNVKALGEAMVDLLLVCNVTIA